jgi:uncharacterized protein with PQ loop repeat
MDDCDFAAFDFKFWLSFFVILGIVASYLPQHYKLLSEKSSEGLSAWYIFLGGISSFSSVANSTLLNLKVFKCCQKIPVGNCISGLMRFFLIFFQWSCFFFIILLFLIFFPRHLRYVPVDISSVDGHPVMTNQWKTAIFVSLLLALYFLFVISLSIILISTTGFDSSYTKAFGELLGLFSLTLSLVMFVPQIWRTFHLKEIGALSIPGMCIQTPGSFILCLSIYLDPNANWSTWLPTFVSGTLMGLLLILCIKYDWKRKQREKVKSSMPIPVERIETPFG